MLAAAKQFREALKKFDDYKQLTGANQVDVRILRDNIDREIFSIGRVARSGVEPARLQPKSGQQPVSASRARFRFRRKRAFRICASEWKQFRT